MAIAVHVWMQRDRVPVEDNRGRVERIVTPRCVGDHKGLSTVEGVLRHGDGHLYLGKRMWGRDKL